MLSTALCAPPFAPWRPRTLRFAPQGALFFGFCNFYSSSERKKRIFGLFPKNNRHFEGYFSENLFFLQILKDNGAFFDEIRKILGRREGIEGARSDERASKPPPGGRWGADAGAGRRGAGRLPTDYRGAADAGAGRCGEAFANAPLKKTSFCRIIFAL